MARSTRPAGPGEAGRLVAAGHPGLAALLAGWAAAAACPPALYDLFAARGLTALAAAAEWAATYRPAEDDRLCPVAWQPGSDFGGAIGWWRGLCHNEFPSAACLPRAVFDRLAGGVVGRSVALVNNPALRRQPADVISYPSFAAAAAAALDAYALLVPEEDRP